MGTDPIGVKMVETVTVKVFDHTEEDHPTEPVQVIVRTKERIVTELEAIAMGYKPK